ncbi:hypothetical protein B0H14DRAFT_1213592 [Mycena olivaceomarginata]|nr:hypothetical protein B0H14DRAFT_1213592 [Mycena olivaceomarginata]
MATKTTASFLPLKIVSGSEAGGAGAFSSCAVREPVPWSTEPCASAEEEDIVTDVLASKNSSQARGLLDASGRGTRQVVPLVAWIHPMIAVRHISAYSDFAFQPQFFISRDLSAVRVVDQSVLDFRYKRQRTNCLGTGLLTVDCFLWFLES